MHRSSRRKYFILCWIFSCQFFKFTQAKVQHFDHDKYPEIEILAQQLPDEVKNSETSSSKSKYLKADEEKSKLANQPPAKTPHASDVHRLLPNQIQDTEENADHDAFTVQRFKTNKHKTTQTFRKVLHLDLSGAPLKIEYIASLIKFFKFNGITTILLEFRDRFPYNGVLKNIRHEQAYTEEEVKQLHDMLFENNLDVMLLIPLCTDMEYVLVKPGFEKFKMDPDNIREFNIVSDFILPNGERLSGMKEDGNDGGEDGLGEEPTEEEPVELTEEEIAALAEEDASEVEDNIDLDISDEDLLNMSEEEIERETKKLLEENEKLDQMLGGEDEDGEYVGVDDGETEGLEIDISGEDVAFELIRQVLVIYTQSTWIHVGCGRMFTLSSSKLVKEELLLDFSGNF